MDFKFALGLVKSELFGVTCEVDSESRLILEKISNEKFANLQAFGYNFSDIDILKIKEICEKRKTGAPLAYIFGISNFYGLDFKIDESCLIPRFDSEILVENLLKYCKKLGNNLSIIDICSGSGCLGVAFCDQILKKKSIEIDITFVDISSKCLKIAEFNSEKFLQNRVKKKFLQLDVLSNFSGEIFEKYDIIISNPPYIKSCDVEKLEAGVRGFEPKIALDGGEGGLVFYEKFAKIFPEIAKKNAICALEFGFDQASDIKKIFNKISNTIDVFKDLTQNDRCVIFLLDK